MFFSRTRGIHHRLSFVFFKVFYHIISHCFQARLPSLSETLTQDTAANPHPAPASHLTPRPRLLRVPPRTHGAETGFCLVLSPEAGRPLCSPEAGFSLRLDPAGTRLSPTSSPTPGRWGGGPPLSNLTLKWFQRRLFLSHSHRGTVLKNCGKIHRLRSDLPNHFGGHIAAPPGPSHLPKHLPGRGHF